MAKTILLADDSMTIQKVVELTFMDQDYQVVAVSDGESAIQRMAEVNPDLVIADVHMPGASGYDVCRHAKAHHPGTPVLLLVGTFEQFDEQAASAAGSDGDLKKPFDSQELLGQVERLLAAASASVAPAAEAAPMAAPEPAAPQPAAPQPAAPEPAPLPAALATPDFAVPAPAMAEPIFEMAPEPTAPAPAPSFEMAPAVESAPAPAPEVDFAAPAAAPMPEVDFAAPAPMPEVDFNPQPTAPLADDAPMGMPESAPPAAAPETVYAPELATAASVDTEPPTASPETLSTQLIGTQMPSLEPEAAAAPEPEAAAAPEPVAVPEAAPEPAEVEPAEAAVAEPAAVVDGNAVTQPMAARASSDGLSDDDVDRIARRVVELMADTNVRDVAWEVIPDLAEVVIKERIKELERQVESA